MRSLCYSFVLLLGLVAVAASAGTVDIAAGGLPKDTATGEFTLTIVIRNITPAQIQKGTDRDDITKTFEIRFKDIDSNPISFTAAAAALTPVKFYAEKIGDVTEAASSDDSSGVNRDLTYQIRIREAAIGELTAKVDKLKRLSLVFKLGGETVVSETDRTLTKENYAIDAAVPFTTVIGSHKSLVANWTVEPTVTTKGGDGQARAPGSVSVYAFSSDVADGTLLPAKVFSTDEKSADAPTNCVFRAFAKEAIKNAAGCVECPPDAFLNESEIINIPGVYHATAAANSGTVTLSGLTNYTDDNPVHYYVFMEYKPSGLQRSQCAIGIASANYTMTELNGEKDAKIVDFRCFVATAAYGTPLHEDLAIFRQFRDETLLRNQLGQRLVQLYYRLSPQLAAFIAQHDSVRDLTRGGLSLLAELLRQRGYGQTDYTSSFNPEPFYTVAREPTP